MGSDASANGAKPFSLFGLNKVLEAWGELGHFLAYFMSCSSLFLSLKAHGWEVNMICFGVLTLGHFDDFLFLDIYECLWLILYGVLFILKIHHVWVVMF